VIIFGIDIGILTVVCILLLIAAVVYAVKLIKRLVKKKDWQAQAFFLVIILICLGIVGFFEGRLQYTNFMATKVTRQVVGRNDVSAKCLRTLGDSFDLTQYGSAAGWVQWGNKFSKLDNKTCTNFRQWLLSDRKSATDDQAYALHIIIHEAIHLSGEFNESETVYKTTEIFVDIATSLGMDREVAEYWNNYYKTKINPRLPERYRVDWEAKEREKKE
jgi:hypothetical protein